MAAVVMALISFAIPAWSIQTAFGRNVDTSDLQAELDHPQLASPGGIISLLAVILIVVLCIAAMASRNRPTFLTGGILGILFGAFFVIAAIGLMAMQPDENCFANGADIGCNYGAGYGGYGIIDVEIGPGLIIMLISGILTLAFAIATLATAPRLMYAAPAMYAAPLMYQS